MALGCERKTRRLHSGVMTCTDHDRAGVLPPETGKQGGKKDSSHERLPNRL